jgi:dTDP-glucose 4,6-dehydratase
LRHILIGGDGFVGQHLASELNRMGENVLVADVVNSKHAHYGQVPFRHLDITDRQSFEALDLGPADVVYNLSARMLSPILPRSQRREFFLPVNTAGVANLLEHMARRDCGRLVQFTTDMVYGHSLTVPQAEDHPAHPLGPYGESKLLAEQMCRAYRSRGFQISIFRPRLIIGPGRMGILEKLFRLVERHLPVPMIGSGANPYQFVSVYDCASACICAWKAGFPNSEYNLGSDNPPPVRDLLRELVRAAGSRSILLPTPARLVKIALTALDRINLPLMDPEQYLIADEYCLLDCSKAKREIGWHPKHTDVDMLLAAYREYRAGGAASRNVTTYVPANGKRLAS